MEDNINNTEYILEFFINSLISYQTQTDEAVILKIPTEVFQIYYKKFPIRQKIIKRK
jgi:hypothetical protein